VVAQPSNSWVEQWYRAKSGRPAPTEQARIDAARLVVAPTAAVKSDNSTAHADAWLEQWFQTKYGRHTPKVEARLRESRLGNNETITSRSSAPANPWLENWYRAKTGRPSPLAQAQ
jgi:hypothetical protein